MSRVHKPNDPYNCLCANCVCESLARMGLLLKTVPMTKKEWMRLNGGVPAHPNAAHPEDGETR